MTSKSGTDARSDGCCGGGRSVATNGRESTWRGSKSTVVPPLRSTFDVTPGGNLNSETGATKTTGAKCPPCSGDCRQGRDCPGVMANTVEWIAWIVTVLLIFLGIGWAVSKPFFWLLGK